MGNRIAALLIALFAAIAFSQPQTGGFGTGGNAGRFGPSFPSNTYFSALYSTPTICSCTALSATDGTAMTFVRGSSATCERQGFATTGLVPGDLITCGSGIPRLTVQSSGRPGVLLESAADNYNLRSAEFDNAAWIKAGVGVAAPVVTADFAVGLFGTTTADRIQFAACPAITDTSVLSQPVTPVSSPTSSSVYCRANTGTPTISACVYSTGAGDRLCTSHSLNTSTWTRILSENRSFTTSMDFTIGCENRTALYTGASNTGAADVICEAVQTETGSYATSYIPTTSAIVTRNSEEAQFNRSLPIPTSGFCTAATVQFRNLGTTGALVAGAGLWAPSLSSTAATSIFAPYMWPYTVSASSNIGIDATSTSTPAGYSSSAVDPLAGSNRYIAGHDGSRLFVCRNGTCTPNATGSSVFSGITFASLRLNVNNVLRQNAIWSDIQFDPNSAACTR